MGKGKGKGKGSENTGEKWGTGTGNACFFSYKEPHFFISVPLELI